MQSIASMMAEDFLCFPLNRDALQDCVDYMTVVLSHSRSVATRSAQNWGLALYYRILLQSLMPDLTDGWRIPGSK